MDSIYILETILEVIDSLYYRTCWMGYVYCIDYVCLNVYRHERVNLGLTSFQHSLLAMTMVMTSQPPIAYLGRVPHNNSVRRQWPQLKFHQFNNIISSTLDWRLTWYMKYNDPSSNFFWHICRNSQLTDDHVDEVNMI